MKRTQWFPASVKPVHVGRYEVYLAIRGVLRLWWDGAQWRVWAADGWPVRLEWGDMWRGLTEPHK